MFKKPGTALGWLGSLLTVWAILQVSRGDIMPAWLDSTMSIVSWVVIAFAFIVSVRLIFISRRNEPSPELKAIETLSSKIDDLIKEIREDRKARK